MSLPYRLRHDDEGRPYVSVDVKGYALVENPLLNKGTAWPLEEREELGLAGLLPPYVSTEEEQLERAHGDYLSAYDDLERYVRLQALHDRNEILFYKLLRGHLADMLPIVYTPTVGVACQQFHRIFRRSRGVYVTADQAHSTEELIRNATRSRQVRLAVVTDGERILGLGDLGANGMGIPIGKLSLYVAAGGAHPATLLPILLDTGTDNEQLRSDPLYLGTRRPRLRGEAYQQVVDDFVRGFFAACPGSVLQFEDFAKTNALTLLERYREQHPVFNDDIQGTGAVTLAAVLAAGRLTGRKLADERFLLVGAGAAGLGVARTIHAALGGKDSAKSSLFMRDSRGLLTTSREDLGAFKREFAQPAPALDSRVMESDSNLAEQARLLRPTVLIGTTGQPGLFDRAVIEAVSAASTRPLVLPLSNPTSSSEAVPEQVLQWSHGQALLATGSPFPPVVVGGRRHVIGQCNNVFVFPAIGLAALAARCSRVGHAMFTRAARALADTVSDDRLVGGALLPDVADIREATVTVALAAARAAWESGWAEREVENEAEIRALMWEPAYLPCRYEGS